ncbi:hypothetical protein FF1_027944 [Malus domestica]
MVLGLVVGVGTGLASIWMLFLSSFVGLVAFWWLIKNANRLLYETQLGERQYSLPPGDLGLPFIGNMWSFLRAFKSNNPESFLDKFVSRSISTPLYLLAFMHAREVFFESRHATHDLHVLNVFICVN